MTFDIIYSVELRIIRMSSNNLRNNVLDFAPTFGTQLTLDKEETAWVLARNSKECRINWQFTVADSRIKLKRLYPTN